MNRVLHQYLNPSDFAVFSIMLVLIGLVLSPFLLSVGMWGLAIAAIWHQFFNTAFEKWNTMQPIPRLFVLTIHRIWRNFIRQPVYWSLGLLLLIPFLSGLWSEEHGFWLSNVRVRIPFLSLPLTFASLPRFNQRQYRFMVLFFVVLMTIVGIGVSINFYLHKTEVMELLRMGRSVPVPRSHIRFSLLVALAILFCFFSLRQISLHFSAPQRWSLALCGIFLFGFIHLLSVRSGIAAMYVGVLVYAFHAALLSRKWLVSSILMLAFCVTAYLAVQYVPSLAMRLGYMRYDLAQYEQGNGSLYSDSGRFASVSAGWQVAKDHVLIGTGTGDLPKAVEKATLMQHPEFEGSVKLPHNQWLFIFASTGLLGLVCSVFALFCWLGYKRLRRSSLLVGFQAIVFVSFLVEYTLETSIGVAFFLFFYCILVQPTQLNVSEN
jgi:O-antigen ligase